MQNSYKQNLKTAQAIFIIGDARANGRW